MDFLVELWMPILLSAVLVFVASSISHMVLQFHRPDYDKLPDEEEALEPLRKLALPPGNYYTPHCGSNAEMASPEFLAKLERGPVAFVNVIPSGPPNMGVFLGSWFAHTLVVGAVVAYIARLGLAPGAEYLDVFQMTGAIAFLVYGLGDVPQSIWKGQKWSTTARFAVDGLVYGLLTGGAFAWLWPGARAAVGA